ncbi:MAG: hypothetical protein EPO65_00325 [Dehalococcoidia bacterium]|nr:MAG: hypothetical protein EPO65_00325 [Dehalococcoidia bacterium]
MPVRLLPWSPEYGTAMRMDTAEADEADRGDVDMRVERDTWAPVTPSGVAPLRVRIVDGVRRAEAHALDDDLDGLPAFGLFASYAVGVVSCEPAAARVVDEACQVVRQYLHTGAQADDRVLTAGSARLDFRARTVPNAKSADDLVDAMNRAMLDAEAHLAESLSADESWLTLVDGPLRGLRQPGRRVVGYIKRVQEWYVPAREAALLPTLVPGERTPIFSIAAKGAGADHLRDGRYSWYVRIAHLEGPVHPLGGVLRLECSQAVGIEGARDLADLTAALLPRLASSPVRDPRAPQNLTPTGALEARLTHLLGDRRLIYRLLLSELVRGLQ